MIEKDALGNMNPAFVAQLIKSKEDESKEAHRQFYEAIVRSLHAIPNDKDLFLKELSKLEDYIASKAQLLKLLDETDEFYTILTEQLRLSKIIYIQAYKKFSKPAI